MYKKLFRLSGENASCFTFSASVFKAIILSFFIENNVGIIPHTQQDYNDISRFETICFCAVLSHKLIEILS